jgi:hypothetical protein
MVGNGMSDVFTLMMDSAELYSVEWRCRVLHMLAMSMVVLVLTIDRDPSHDCLSVIYLQLSL